MAAGIFLAQVEPPSPDEPPLRCIASGSLLNGAYVFSHLDFAWGSANGVGSEHALDDRR